MNKNTLFSVLMIAVLVVPSSMALAAKKVNTSAAQNNKIDICHYDTTTGTYSTLNISSNAWGNPGGHSGHANDYLGACVVVPPPPATNTPPVITLTNGGNFLNIPWGSQIVATATPKCHLTPSDQTGQLWCAILDWARADDLEDGQIPNSQIDGFDRISTGVEGSFFYEYRVTDSGGLSDREPRVVNVFNSTIPDRDSDGVLNASDNCPFVANPSQSNTDGDGFGDACDNNGAGDNLNWYSLDMDSDGVANYSDNCPFVYNPTTQATSGPAVFGGNQYCIPEAH